MKVLPQCHFDHQKSHTDYLGIEFSEKQQLHVRTMAWCFVFTSWNIYFGFDPQNGRDFSLRRHVRTRSGVHPVSYAMDTMGGEKVRALTWKFTRCLCWELRHISMGRKSGRGMVVFKLFLRTLATLPCVVNIPLIVLFAHLFSCLLGTHRYLMSASSHCFVVLLTSFFKIFILVLQNLLY